MFRVLGLIVAGFAASGAGAMDVFTDQDSDGVPDYLDNCIARVNPRQIDSDRDSFGNVCDADFNNDGIIDSGDVDFLRVEILAQQSPVAIPAEYSPADLNVDGAINLSDILSFAMAWSYNLPPGPAADPDWDADTVLNADDAFPFDPDNWSDCDNDGLGDETMDADQSTCGFALSNTSIYVAASNGTTNPANAIAPIFLYEPLNNVVRWYGVWEFVSYIGPVGSTVLYTTRMTDGLIDLGTGVVSAAAYQCIEGQFGSVVGANLCGNYGFGPNFTDEGGAGDDEIYGAPQSLDDWLLDPALTVEVGGSYTNGLKLQNNRFSLFGWPYQDTILEFAPADTTDSDGDGHFDLFDAFIADPEEWSDRDKDGVGDNGDRYPDNPAESADSDGDRVGDNADEFPDDPDEYSDRDEDGVGDNADVFPDDPDESADCDDDGVGDNADPCDLPVLSSSILTMTSNGVARTFYIEVPSDQYTSGELKPLVIGFHGTGGSHLNWTEDWGWYNIHDYAGDDAVLVYPNALPNGAGQPQWDRFAGDLQYFEDLLDKLESIIAYDRERVFVMGHSSGAGMANEVGCVYGDRIRAISPSAGGLLSTSCVGSVGVMLHHGVDDLLVSIDIGRQARDFWALYNGFDPASHVLDTTYPDCQEYDTLGTSDYPVVFCESTEETWEGHQPASYAMQASWEFFQSLDAVPLTADPPPNGGNDKVGGSPTTNITVTIKYPDDMVTTPRTGAVALYYDDGDIGGSPDVILNDGFDPGVVSAGEVVTYNNIPVSKLTTQTLPQTYVLSVNIYMEEGSYPVPTPGVDTQARTMITIDDAFTPLVVPGVHELTIIDSLW